MIQFECGVQELKPDPDLSEMCARFHVAQGLSELFEGEGRADDRLEGMLFQEAHEFLKVRARIDEHTNHPEALHRERRKVHFA
jgi:hypothetical protein